MRAGGWLLVCSAALLVGCGGAEGDGGNSADPEKVEIAGCTPEAAAIDPGSGAELLGLLEGRWKRCGGETVPAGADGIEFRPGGFWLFLQENETGALVGNFDETGWETRAARDGADWVLTLVHSTGGEKTARVSISGDVPHRLRLGFSENDATGTAWYLPVH